MFLGPGRNQFRRMYHVLPQDRGFANRVPPARRALSHPSSAQLGLESVDHHAAAFVERFARAPYIVPTDAVQNMCKDLGSAWERSFLSRFAARLLRGRLDKQAHQER